MPGPTGTDDPTPFAIAPAAPDAAGAFARTDDADGPAGKHDRPGLVAPSLTIR